MADFKKGDVVKLNSGGPLMTVAEVLPGSGRGQMVACTWFDGAGRPISENFYVETVTLNGQ